MRAHLPTAHLPLAPSAAIRRSLQKSQSSSASEPRLRGISRLSAPDNLRVRLIGMEACGGSHFLCRSLREQGHEVRLMPEQYVKPYVKTNKNDYIDAEAIAEAVGRPRMRFVPIKSDDQLDMQSLHCVRDRWVAHRTARLGNRSGDSHNRRPATTGFTRFCQVCWRKQRWQNGRTRRSRNLKLRQALQGCEIN
jgi:transposase